MDSSDSTHNVDRPSSATERPFVDLSRFNNAEYDPGRSTFVRTAWYYLSLIFFESGWFPISRPKSWLLRVFGAKIGLGLVIKPHVRIKYPWRLTIGDHCWIGQQTWIDNIEDVTLGNNVCVSQKTYFCTGSHDHRRRSFDLIARPIRIEDGVWLCAGATILGGGVVQSNAIVTSGSVVLKDVDQATIVSGNPAKVIGKRQVGA